MLLGCSVHCVHVVCSQTNHVFPHESCWCVAAAGTSLLCSLNELLCRTAVMVQPLVYSTQIPANRMSDNDPLVSFLDVPLPLCLVLSTDQQQQQQQQVARSSSSSSWDPFEGPSGAVQGPATAAVDEQTAAAAARSSCSVTAAGATAQQPAAAVTSNSAAVLAVDRQSCKLREFVVPGYLTAALDQLQLRSAVGWLRLVKLPSSSSKGALLVA